ncbi:MAG: dTDP-4-dehydrorhamnose reductase [Janthinobacterium lividum]
MKILLFGKSGQLGWELQRSLAALGEVHASGRLEADFGDVEALRASVRDYRPDIIVNAAAYTAVDRAEGDERTAHGINALAPGVLAEAARECGAWLVHYSTDYVFDGRKESPYREDDRANPLSVYGRTKFEGEERIRASGAHHLILRTSWVFGPHGANFPKTILRLARERPQLEVVADQFGAPTSAELLADLTALALQHIALRGVGAGELAGTYHVAASGRTSWHAYACHVVAQALAQGARLQAGPAQISPVTAAAWRAAAPRPRNSLLDTGKFRTAFGLALPDWRHHVNRLVAELAEGGNL